MKGAIVLIRAVGSREIAFLLKLFVALRGVWISMAIC